MHHAPDKAKATYYKGKRHLSKGQKRGAKQKTEFTPTWRFTPDPGPGVTSGQETSARDLRSLFASESCISSTQHVVDEERERERKREKERGRRGRARELDGLSPRAIEGSERWWSHFKTAHAGRGKISTHLLLKI